MCWSCLSVCRSVFLSPGYLKMLLTDWDELFREHWFWDTQETIRCGLRCLLHRFRQGVGKWYILNYPYSNTFSAHATLSLKYSRIYTGNYFLWRKVIMPWLHLERQRLTLFDGAMILYGFISHKLHDQTLWKLIWWQIEVALTYVHIISQASDHTLSEERLWAGKNLVERYFA